MHPGEQCDPGGVIACSPCKAFFSFLFSSPSPSLHHPSPLSLLFRVDRRCFAFRRSKIVRSRRRQKAARFWSLNRIEPFEGSKGKIPVSKRASFARAIKIGFVPGWMIERRTVRGSGATSSPQCRLLASIRGKAETPLEYLSSYRKYFNFCRSVKKLPIVRDTVYISRWSIKNEEKEENEGGRNGRGF